jgi:NAD-dependent dihydropyrimidine dehydrogenase PreA subunit
MAKRKIIKIDVDKCTGCGDCIPNCPEGAIQLIDGKARLISDLFCDGLGACLGTCPVGAITIEEREAKAYDERKVMENIITHGPATIKAHLAHLRDHGETEYLKAALAVLKEKAIEAPVEFSKDKKEAHLHQGCPGARMMEFGEKKENVSSAPVASALTQWPIQLHLVSPHAPYFQGKDVVLAADCVAYTLGDFHSRFLQGKSLAIACPKLDSNKDIYIEKLVAMIDVTKINTLTVLIMEVPCCGGLMHLALAAAKKAQRKIPIKQVIVSIRGEVLKEDWVTS